MIYIFTIFNLSTKINLMLERNSHTFKMIARLRSKWKWKGLSKATEVRIICKFTIVSATVQITWDYKSVIDIYVYKYIYALLTTCVFMSKMPASSLSA